MKLVWLLVVSLAAVAKCDITGMNLTAGDCLCINADETDVRSSACGSILGKANNGSCYFAAPPPLPSVKTGREWCTLNEKSYEFYRVWYGASEGWIAGNYLNMGPYFSCKWFHVKGKLLFRDGPDGQNDI